MNVEALVNALFGLINVLIIWLGREFLANQSGRRVSHMAITPAVHTRAEDMVNERSNGDDIENRCVPGNLLYPPPSIHGLADDFNLVSHLDGHFVVILGKVTLHGLIH